MRITIIKVIYISMILCFNLDMNVLNSWRFIIYWRSVRWTSHKDNLRKAIRTQKLKIIKYETNISVSDPGRQVLVQIWLLTSDFNSMLQKSQQSWVEWSAYITDFNRSFASNAMFHNPGEISENGQFVVVLLWVIRK